MDAFSLIDEDEKKRKAKLGQTTQVFTSNKTKEQDDILNFARSYKPPKEKEQESFTQQPAQEAKKSVWETIKETGSRIGSGIVEGIKDIFKQESPEKAYASFTKTQQKQLDEIKLNPNQKAEYLGLSSAPVIYKRINEISEKIKDGVISNKDFISGTIYKSLTDEKNKLENLVSQNVLDENIAKQMFDEAINIKKSRYQTGIVTGFIESGKSLLDAFSWATSGIEPLSKASMSASDKVDEWINQVRSEDATFADSLSSGVGSSLFFFLPGFGVAKGASFLSAVSPKLALIFGGSVSTALEASGEAGSVYKENFKAKQNKKEAGDEATKTFWANSALIGITNLLGPFAEGGAGLKKVLLSSSLEGLQEFGQQVISNINTGRDFMEGTIESGIIGTIIGAGMGNIDIAEEKKQQEKQKEEIKVKPEEKVDVVPEVVKEAVDQAKEAKTEVQPLNIQGLDDLTNTKIEELNKKDAENPAQEGYIRVYQAVEKGKETNYVFKTPQELAQYKNNTTSETEQFQYKDVKPEQIEEIESKPGVFQIKGETIKIEEKKPEVKFENKLIEEAKKYKTSDEFINSNKLFTGRDGKIDEFSKIKSKDIFFTKNNKVAEFYAGDKNNISEAYIDTANFVDLKTQESIADFVKNNFNEDDINKLYKNLEFRNGVESVTGMKKDEFYKNQIERLSKESFAGGERQKLLLEKLRNLGYKGTLLKDALFNEDDISYVVFDRSSIKTKSQLTEIWNEANKELKTEKKESKIKKTEKLQEFVKDEKLEKLKEYTSNKYIDIKELESKPALLYGGKSAGVFTDGYTMIVDKKAANKINDMAIEKATNRKVAEIKRNAKKSGKTISNDEALQQAKKSVKEQIATYSEEGKYPPVSKVMDNINNNANKYVKAQSMGYVPISDTINGIVFKGSDGPIVINGTYYRTLQEMFPKAELFVYHKGFPTILKQGETIKAVIMPIYPTENTLALIEKGKGKMIGEQKGGSVGAQKSIFQREFSGRKVELVQGIQFPEMVNLVKEITGMVPKVRKSLNSALGRFYGKTGEIKLKADIFENPNDAAQVLAHEIGHLFDWTPDKNLKRGNLLGRIHSLNKFLKQTFGESEIKNKEIRTELINLGKEWNPFDPSKKDSYTKYRLSPAELYADSISVLLNDPALLKEKAPKFWDEFFEYLDKKPVVKEALFDTYNLLSRGEEAVLTDREENIRGMFKKGEDLYAVKRAEKVKRDSDYMFRIKYDFIDKNQKVIDKVNQLTKEGKYIAAEDNPVYWLEEQNYIGSVVKNWIEENIAPIYTSFKENEISWEDFGEALFLERVINERGKIANPLGYTPETAKKQLDFLKNNLGEEKSNVLSDALEQYRKAVGMWLDKAVEAGVYNKDTVAQLKANPSYATFQVLDYLDQYIPASIKKSVGTLKEIANPADATILKTIGLIRAIEKNTAKAKTVKMLKTSFSNEVQDAKTVWNGKSHMPIDPKEDGMALFTVMENGKIKGYYVDEYIAKSFESGGASQTNAVLSVLKFLNTGFYKPLFTTFNLGFQSFNAVRDFMRFYKNVPNMSIAKALLRYGQAIKPAFERSFTGVSNETIREMERLKILGTSYNDIINGRTNEDKQIEYMLQKYDILSKKEKESVWKYPLKILDLIEKTGNFIESLPKIAGYKELNGKMPTKEMASFIRTSVGSPDFMRKGASYAWYNQVFMFSNAIKEGMRSDIAVATNPKTRSGYWFKTAKVTYLPKIIMFAAAAGLFGDELKKLFAKISEYDKTNYTVVPFGTDENGRTVYIRIPQDETGRFLGGLLWKTMRFTNNDQSILQNMSDLFAYNAGQVPNVSPTINIIQATAQFMAGQNPYDFFRGRNIIPDNEFKAGGKYALKPFATWMFQSLGGGVFLNTYVTEQTPATKTWVQKTIELPVVSNIMGRWIKVSDYGTVEQAKKIEKAAEQKAAEERIRKRESVKEAVNEYISSKNKSPEAKKQMEKDLVFEVLGYKPKSGDTSGKAKERDIIKRFRIGVLQNKYDPYVDQLLYATSNDEKILYLKKIKETSSESSYMRLKSELIKEKVVSKEVFKKIK